MLATTARLVSHSFPYKKRYDPVDMRDERRTLLSVTPISCAGCASKCQPIQRIVSVPGLHQTDVVLSISTRDQIVVLFDSLLLPLVGFVTGAWVGERLNFNEPIIVLAAIFGMLVAGSLCKTHSFSSIQIDKAR